MTPRERKDLPWIVAAFAVVMVVIFVGASRRSGGGSAVSIAEPSDRLKLSPKPVAGSNTIF
jgi:hypothetical protein